MEITHVLRRILLNVIAVNKSLNDIPTDQEMKRILNLIYLILRDEALDKTFLYNSPEYHTLSMHDSEEFKLLQTGETAQRASENFKKNDSE